MVDDRSYTRNTNAMLPGNHLATKELENFSLDYEQDGRARRTQDWAEVLHQANGWATLLVCYRERSGEQWSGPLFKLVRLRKLYGLWQRTSTFNLKPHHMPGVMVGAAKAMGQGQ